MKMKKKFYRKRPVGLVVLFSLRVREVPGSIPGQALPFYFAISYTRMCFGKLSAGIRKY